MYDIIGDIHGEASRLEQLLVRLGYEKDRGYYRHLTRKAIFLGDFINKGSETRAVLSLVKGMTDHQTAQAVVGNHELYLVSYFSKNKCGQHIREHTPAHTAQHQATLEAFSSDKTLLMAYVDWLKTLPLCLELPGVRIVHACWHKPSIAYLRQAYPENCLSDRLLYHLIENDSQEWEALRELLIGTKLLLPASVGGEPFKAKWWQLPVSNRYFTLAARPDQAKGDVAVEVPVNTEPYVYPEQAPPLFFGHYNVPGLPYLSGRNHCCLDFSLPDQPWVVAYRWQGEQQLTAAHLVYA